MLLPPLIFFTPHSFPFDLLESFQNLFLNDFVFVTFFLNRWSGVHEADPGDWWLCVLTDFEHYETHVSLVFQLVLLHSFAFTGAVLSFLVSLPPADLKLHSSVRAQKLPQDTFQSKKSNAGCRVQFGLTVFSHLLLSDCSYPTLSTSLQVSGGSQWTASPCSTIHLKRLCSMPARCMLQPPPPTTASTSATCSATMLCCCRALSTPAAGPSPSLTSRYLSVWLPQLTQVLRISDI